MTNNTKISAVPSFEMIGALADAFDKSPLTIQRWIQSKSELLTGDTAREVFRRFGVSWNKDTGMVDEILENVSVDHN